MANSVLNMIKNDMEKKKFELKIKNDFINEEKELNDNEVSI